MTIEPVDTVEAEVPARGGGAPVPVSAYALGRELERLYPGAFGFPRRPLKLGIHKDIHARHPSWPLRMLAAHLSHWTGQRDYLLALRFGAVRKGLDGKASGTVGEEEARVAAERLRGCLPPQDRCASRVHSHAEALDELGRAEGIRTAYRAGEPLSEGDAAVVMDLLRHHPSAAEKLGCGIASIVADRRKPTFALIRTDGTRDTFSVVKALGAKYGLAAPPVPDAAPTGRRRKARTRKPKATAAVAAPRQLQATERPDDPVVVVPCGPVKVVGVVPAEILVAAANLPDGAPNPLEVTVTVAVAGGPRIAAVITGKAFRRAWKAARETGGIALVEGRLALGGRVENPGLIVQPPKATDAEAA